MADYTLTDRDREAIAKAQTYMSDGEVTPRDKAMIRAIVSEERAAGYDIPADETRDLMGFAAGYLSATADADALRSALREAVLFIGRACGYSSYGCKCSECALLARIDALLSPTPNSTP